MRLVVVADADLKERLRCARSIASRAAVSAIGVADWDELEHAIDGADRASLVVVYAHPLPGAPDDAVARLSDRAHRVVVASADGAPPGRGAPGLEHTLRPIAEESLALLAHATGREAGANGLCFAPTDVLQMLCPSGAAYTLIVEHEGADSGVIEVQDGYVWTAFDGLGVGEDAFARLVGPGARARVRPASGGRKERTIFKDIAELLLDSLRRIDEGGVTPAPPLSARRLEAALLPPAELAARVKHLSAEAKRLLLERNYRDAVDVLQRLADLDPSSPLVRANLEQLRRLGYTL